MRLPAEHGRCNRTRPDRVLGGDGRNRPSPSAWPGTSTAPSRRSSAHQDRCSRSRCACSATRHDAEEAAQDALVRAYRALAGYDAERIRDLRLRAWLATIVAEPVPEPRPTPRAGRDPLAPLVDARRRAWPPSRRRSGWSQAVPADERERLGALLAALPTRYRSRRRPPPRRRPVLSRARRVLGRPEGTVKAQVHRGLAHAAHRSRPTDDSSSRR